MSFLLLLCHFCSKIVLKCIYCFVIKTVAGITKVHKKQGKPFWIPRVIFSPFLRMSSGRPKWRGKLNSWKLNSCCCLTATEPWIHQNEGKPSPLLTGILLHLTGYLGDSTSGMRGGGRAFLSVLLKLGPDSPPLSKKEIDCSSSQLFSLIEWEPALGFCWNAGHQEGFHSLSC